MDYQNLVQDFAERTWHNLGVIWRLHKQREEVYEVTQLINSMLGLLVLPKERYYANIPQTQINQLRKDGWPEPLFTNSSPVDLRDLIRRLRNSVAHFNIEFTESDGQINGVVLSNKYNGNTTWRATLTLDELKNLTERLIKLIHPNYESKPQ